MAIDIGPGAVSRGTFLDHYTLVDKTNPANATGNIDTVEIWALTALTSVDVATFFVVAGNNLSTRDWEPIGNVVHGSKQTFSGLTMDVEIDDYLGIYFVNQIEADDSGGSGLWHVSAVDHIPCTNQAFSTIADWEISIYGTGTEAGGAEGKSAAMGVKMIAEGLI